MTTCTTYEFPFGRGTHYTGIAFVIQSKNGQDILSDPIPEEDIILARDPLSKGIVN